MSEELKDAKITVTHEGEKYTLLQATSDHTFQFDVFDYAEQIQPGSDSFKPSTLRAPEFVEHSVGNISSEYNLGSYKTRSIMLAYGHDKIEYILRDEISELEAMYSPATNKSKFQSSQLNQRRQSMHYSIANQQSPIGYYIAHTRAGRLEKLSRFFGFKTSLLIRHCMAISVNHSDCVTVWDEEAQAYEWGLKKWVKDHRLPQVIHSFEMSENSVR